MASRKEVAVRLMEHLCEHGWHGYSQVSRYGDGEGQCPVEVDGVTYYLEQGDRDCSSAVITAFEAAGISCGGATYTGNMRSCMTSTGNFVWHPMSDGYTAQRGDVYLNEANHTAMCVSAMPDMLAEFAISETGGIDGAEGDQTGYESYVHAYYDYPWDGILECVTDGGAAPTSPEQDPFVGYDGAEGSGVAYEAHTLAHGWLGHVTKCDGTEEGYAGYQGSPIDGVRACRFDGHIVKVQTHTMGAGWNDWTVFDGSLRGSNSSRDGYSGDFGRAIDGIRVEGCQCRVRTDGDWYGWMVDGQTPEGDGYCGDFGKPITGVQMRA